MEGRIARRRVSGVLLAAGLGLVIGAADRARGQVAESAGGESQMTLRKTVQSRSYQGKEIAGEERTIGKGDSLWRILIQEKGLEEKRFQSYLVVIRGLNPQLKDIDVLRVGDALFIPLRPEEAAGLRVAKPADGGPTPAPARTGAAAVYRVKAREHLYQILREQLGVRDEKQLAGYYAMTKDLNPEIKNWDALREGEMIRLPALASAREPAKSERAAAPSAPAPAQAMPTPTAQSGPPAIDAQYARRHPAAENFALLAQVVENLGAVLERSGEEVVRVKDSAVRFDKNSFPVVVNPKINQRVVIDPAGNIPASLRGQLNSPEIGTPVLSLTPRMSLHEAVTQMLGGLGYQSLPAERPVVIQEAGVSYEAKGSWMALAPEESNKAPEIYVINLTDRAGGVPDYLIAQLESRGLYMRDVVVAAVDSKPAVGVNAPQSNLIQIKSWPRDKREIVDSLLRACDVPFGVAETLAIKLGEGLTVETRADRVFEIRGHKIALFFQRMDSETKKALGEKQAYKSVELDVAALSAREIIGRLLGELGEQASYREHRFPVAGGAIPDRLVISAWGFLLPQRSLFVTDREIPQPLHRFFFDKGLEIVYFQ